MSGPHVLVEPKIIYPGTPVVLVSTVNPDQSPNLAPISSFWALGWTALLGLGRKGRTHANLEHSGECVLNLPSADLWPSVERLAPLTGQVPPPPHVLQYGGRYEPDKFGAAGLTPQASVAVRPPRVVECPLQLEARLISIHPLAHDSTASAVEVQVLRVHAAASLLSADGRRFDPGAWHPLLYNFRRYHGLGPELGRSFREGR